MVEVNDWRINGQENYLKGETWYFKQYSDKKTGTDHDHCEFCFAKFSNIIPEALKSGYATIDDYRWMCVECFIDFKEMFKFKIGTE